MAKSYRKFIAGTAAAAVVASAAPGLSVGAAGFNDQIPTWAKDAVDYLVDKGAIGGYPDGSYQPYAEIKRGEAAKMLAVALGLDIDDNAKASFGDTKDHWSSKYVAALQAQKPGVINGYGDGSFKPENTITREELAKMTVEAYGLELDKEVEIDFRDNTGWGKEYVNVLASLGIVAGVSQGEFDPGANVTRGQFPVFVHRAEVPGVRIKVGKTPTPAPVNTLKLTIEGDSQGNDLPNGEAKIYTVTAKDSEGKALQNVVLNVTFEENLGTNDERQRNVTVTNSDNETVIPYQSSDGEEVAAEIVTDKDGKATFTVSGSNDTVTPIVFLDGSNQAVKTDGGKPQLPFTQDDRFDADREIYVKAAPVSFGVTKYKIEIEGKRTKNAAIAYDFDKETQGIQGDEHNGREYVIKVTNPDGTPFSGGYVNVGIEEYVDDVLNNNPTNAYYVQFVGTANKQQGVVKLDSKGEAKVTLASTKQNDKATPIVWVDQNSSSNAQSGKLEKGEPVSDQSKVEYTNFQPSRVDNGELGAKLEVLDLTNAARGFEGDIGNVEDVKGFKFTLLNQSGKPFLPPTLGQNWDDVDGPDWNLPARVTYTVKNTGSNIVRVHASDLFENVNLENSELADDVAWAGNRYVDIFPGGTVTIAGDVKDDSFWNPTAHASTAIAVYSLNGESKVDVKASAVVDSGSIEFGDYEDYFFDDYTESDSVAVGPVSKKDVALRNSVNAPRVVKVLEKDLDNDGSVDTIELTFDEEVYNFEAKDFRLFTGTTDLNEPANKAEYGTKDNDISQTDKKKIVLSVEEFGGLGSGFGLIKNIATPVIAEILVGNLDEDELAQALVANTKFTEEKLAQLLIDNLTEAELAELIKAELAEQLTGVDIEGLTNAEIVKLLVDNLTEERLAELLVDNSDADELEKILVDSFTKAELEAIAEELIEEQVLQPYYDALFPTTLHYDPSFSGDKAVADEFNNKVNAFVVKYVDFTDKDGDLKMDLIEKNYSVTGR